MEAVKIFTVALPNSLYERLDAFCKGEGLSKVYIIRKSIERELKRREKRFLKGLK